MEKAYESERIYEINSDEWLLGRLLGMPQSEVKQKIEKSQTQHIAADHSLQMISNLEKKLSELRGEILETIQKGDNEPKFYNDSYTPPEGYTASGYYKDKYYEVPTTPSDGATNWKQRNPDLRSAPNDSAMRSNSAAMNRGKPKPKRPDFANGNPYGESETGDWRETPNPPADHPNFQAMRPPQQVMGPYNGPPERNPYNQDPIESFVEAGRVIRDKVNDGVKRVGKFFNNTVQKAGENDMTIINDLLGRYVNEYTKNQRRSDGTSASSRTGPNQVTIIDPRERPASLNDGKPATPMTIPPNPSAPNGLWEKNGRYFAIPSDEDRAYHYNPNSPYDKHGNPKDWDEWSKGKETDADGNYLEISGPYDDRVSPETQNPEDAEINAEISAQKQSAQTHANYGRDSSRQARGTLDVKLPPMKPIPNQIGSTIDRNQPKMIPPAKRNNIPPRGDFNNPPAPVAQDNNELKASFGGNTHETYRLLEDDGHVLRRGLTAENYEMIKGLALVLRISETEVLHRLEKNGAL